MQKLFVPLERPLLRKLLRIAELQRRSPQLQAAFYIEGGLRQAECEVAALTTDKHNFSEEPN